MYTSHTSLIKRIDSVLLFTNYKILHKNLILVYSLGCALGNALKFSVYLCLFVMIWQIKSYLSICWIEQSGIGIWHFSIINDDLWITLSDWITKLSQLWGMRTTRSRRCLYLRVYLVEWGWQIPSKILLINSCQGQKAQSFKGQMAAEDQTCSDHIGCRKKGFYLKMGVNANCQLMMAPISWA